MSHVGKGTALNRGVAESRAGLLCFLDQDDIVLPDRLCLQVAVFDAEPAAEAVYSDYERVTNSGEWLGRFISRQASGEECLDGWQGDRPRLDADAHAPKRRVR